MFSTSYGHSNPINIDTPEQQEKNSSCQRCSRPLPRSMINSMSVVIYPCRHTWCVICTAISLNQNPNNFEKCLVCKNPISYLLINQGRKDQHPETNWPKNVISKSAAAITYGNLTFLEKLISQYPNFLIAEVEDFNSIYGEIQSSCKKKESLLTLAYYKNQPEIFEFLIKKTLSDGITQKSMAHIHMILNHIIDYDEKSGALETLINQLQNFYFNHENIIDIIIQASISCKDAEKIGEQVFSKYRGDLVNEKFKKVILAFLSSKEYIPFINNLLAKDTEYQPSDDNSSIVHDVAKNNDTAKLIKLLDYGINLYLKDANDKTIIDYLLAHEKISGNLLERVINKAYINGNDKQSEDIAINIATKCIKMNDLISFKQLLNKFKELRFYNTKLLIHILYRTIELDKLDFFEIMCEHSFTNNLKEYPLNTLYHNADLDTYNNLLTLASSKGFVNVIATLINKGKVAVNYLDTYYLLPDENNKFEEALSVAAKNAHINVMRFLIIKGAKLNGDSKYANSNIATPLHRACEHLRPNVIELLLSYSAIKIDVKDPEGHTPYQCLLEKFATKCTNGTFDIKQVIANHSTEELHCLLTFASIVRDIPNINYLIEHFFPMQISSKDKHNFDKTKTTYFHNAIERGDFNFVTEMIAIEANLSGIIGKTALMEVVQQINEQQGKETGAYYDMIDSLLSKGAKVNLKYTNQNNKEVFLFVELLTLAVNSNKSELAIKIINLANEQIANFANGKVFNGLNIFDYTNECANRKVARHVEANIKKPEIHTQLRQVRLIGNDGVIYEQSNNFNILSLLAGDYFDEIDSAT